MTGLYVDKVEKKPLFQQNATLPATKDQLLNSRIPFLNTCYITVVSHSQKNFPQTVLPMQCVLSAIQKSIAHYLQVQHEPPFKYCQAHIHIHLLALSLTLLSFLSLKDFLIAKTFRHFDYCFNIPYQKTQAQVYITKSIQQQSHFNDSCANCVQGTEKAHGSNRRISIVSDTACHITFWKLSLYNPTEIHLKNALQSWVDLRPSYFSVQRQVCDNLYICIY